MIDSIKFGIDPLLARQSDILEFRNNGNRQTAKYKGLIVELYKDACYVRGSLHKLKNDGVHNADDFRLSAFVETVKDLALTLNIAPDVVLFQSLEFGVNVDLPFSPKDFIRSIVYCNNGNLLNNNLGIEIQFTEYRIKIYLKTVEGYENRLRYEIGVKKTRRIKNITKETVTYCNTLGDLISSKVWRALGAELLNVYDSLLIVDAKSIDTEKLTKKELELFLLGLNPSYWLQEWKRNEKQRALKRFRDIIYQHSTSSMQNDVKGLIASKIGELIDIEVKPIYTPYFGVEVNNQIMMPFHHRCNSHDNREMMQFHTLDEGGLCNIQEPTIKECEITGLSLEIAIKQGSYLSAKGVEYYYLNERETFDNVLLVRLSSKWIGKELKIQFKEIAHSIRNEKYNPKNNPKNNPRNNLKRDIGNLESKSIGLLFSIAETIRKDKKELLKQII